jgi:hypothetical protein
MIDVKDAVKTAMVYVQSLIPEAQQLQLEEVELTGDSWLITISFLRPSSPPTLQDVFGKKREYKTVTLSRETGEPQSLRIRNLANA